MNVNSYHPCVADAEYKQVHSAQDDLSVKKSSVKRQEVRMNENRDVTSFLVSRLNQALVTKCFPPLTRISADLFEIRCFRFKLLKVLKNLTD